MDEKKRQIIEKIKKLLALTESPNENEAALAVVRVREMLDRYNLSLAQIDMSRDDTMAFAEVSPHKKRLYRWESNLAASVANSFDCFPLRKGPVVTFYGEEADVKAAEYTYVYLLRMVGQWAKKYMAQYDLVGTIPNWNGYCWGMVLTLDRRLCAFKEKESRYDDYRAATGQSLIVVEGQKIRTAEEFARENVSSFGKGRKTKLDLESRSFLRGAADGEKVPLHFGVESGTPKPKLYG